MADAGGPRARWPLFLALAVGVVVLDQVTKSWILSNVPSDGAIELLGPYLRLIITENAGGLFGLFQGNAALFALVSAVVMGAIVAYESRAGSGLVATVTLGLLLGGAIGNFIDRIRLGYVVDFADMGIGGLRWYTFNVADAAISTAIVLLVIMAIAPGVVERVDRAAAGTDRAPGTGHAAGTEPGTPASTAPDVQPAGADATAEGPGDGAAADREARVP